MENFHGEHAISSFGVNRTSLEQTSLGEEEYRQIQAFIHRARDFQERMQRLDRFLAAPTPHNESISARLPRNTYPSLWLKLGLPLMGNVGCAEGFPLALEGTDATGTEGFPPAIEAIG